jgi:hypothetical protein
MEYVFFFHKSRPSVIQIKLLDERSNSGVRPSDVKVEPEDEDDEAALTWEYEWFNRGDAL